MQKDKEVGEAEIFKNGLLFQDENNDEKIILTKKVWEDLLEAYDKQNNKFVGVFKTITICATVLIAIWFGLYFWCNRPYVNNGVMQNGNTNTVESTTIDNTSIDNGGQ